MKEQLYCIVCLLALIAIGCKEEEIGDPNYPTLYEALSDQELDTQFDQLLNTPVYGCTLLDDYGFFALNLKDTKLCSVNDSVQSVYSINELDSMAKAAALRYSKYTGVEDSSLMILQTVSTYNTSKVLSYEKFRTDYPDSFPPAWRLTYLPQTLAGMQVRGTGLTVIIDSSQVVAFGGNWFKTIYIPATDQYDEISARETLYNIKLTYSTSTIRPDEDSNWRTGSKVVVPVTRSGQIEMRICWDLFVGSWEILVDSQTGERISAIDLSAL